MIVGGVVFTLIVLFIILNVLYKKTNSFHNQIIDCKKFNYDFNAESLDVINLGSAHSKYSFNYDDEEINGYNFATPQFLYYSYSILKQYSFSLKKGATVIIALPVGVFGLEDFKTDEQYLKYYYFLDNQYIKNYSVVNKWIYCYFPILRTKWLGMGAIYRILFDVDSDIRECIEYNCLSEEEMIQSAKVRINDWNRLFEIDILKNVFLPSEKLNKEFQKTRMILDEMIEYCYSRGFTPVLVTPPVTAYLKNMLPKEFVECFLYDNIKKIKHSEVKYLDYLFSPEFEKNYELFMNSEWLNLNGRKKFTRQVLNEANIRGVTHD